MKKSLQICTAVFYLVLVSLIVNCIIYPEPRKFQVVYQYSTNNGSSGVGNYEIGQRINNDLPDMGPITQSIEDKIKQDSPEITKIVITNVFRVK